MHHEHLSTQLAVTNPNDKPYSQYVQQQQTVLQNDHGISLSHAAAGSLSTIEPCHRLHIQHAYGARQHTFSNMPMLITNNATPTHKVPTNFVLNLMQPVQGEDHPSGPQAYATAIQM